MKLPSNSLIIPYFRKGGLALATIFICLSGCGPSPCPTKGWVSDRCAPYGEFTAGPTTYYIPNTPPNQYKWIGGLTYNPETKVLTSPGLAMHWQDLSPAGGAQAPAPAVDLVLFSLIYDNNNPNRNNVQYLVDRRKLVPLKVVLPYKVTALETMGSPFLEGSTPRKSSYYQLVGRNRAGEAEALFSCPPLDEEFVNEPFCFGKFYPQPGLLVDFIVKQSQLNRWTDIKQSFNKLLTNWEQPLANP